MWVRKVIILLTVVMSNIFSLHTADSECEICFRPTATEADRGPRVKGRSPIDQELERLSKWLLVPG